MIADVYLPQWLDECLFANLKANYCCSNSDMTVIDWNKNDVLNYLGTYFPRSYAEAYCICCNFFTLYSQNWKSKKEISVFDFGCGTGGEVFGLLKAINRCLPNVKQVKIIALDGNQYALRLFEKVANAYSTHVNIEIKYRVVPVEIDDFYDLSILDSIISEKFDIIMSFKAICEFVTKERFEQQNAYKYIAQSFLPKLKSDGIILFVDVTTYNNVSQEWLPMMMDKGLASVNCRIVQSNKGYNQIFTVSHSKRLRDVSKIAWRIIQKLNNHEKRLDD